MLLYRKFHTHLGAKPVSISYKKTKTRPKHSLPESCKVSWYSTVLKWNTDDSSVKHYLSYAYTLCRYTNEKDRYTWSANVLFTYLNTSFPQLNTYCNMEYNHFPPLNRYLVKFFAFMLTYIGKHLYNKF